MEKIVIKAVHGERERMLFQTISILFPECKIEISPGTPATDENDDVSGLANCRKAWIAEL